MPHPPEHYEVNSIKELNELAQQWIPYFKAGDLIALESDLGGGKTHLTKAIMQALGGDRAQVTSPTFSLFHPYELAHQEFQAIYHWDWYRIDNQDDLERLGWHEYLEHQALHIIEWPSKFPELLSFPHYKISLNRDKSKGENYRKITLHKP